MNRIGTIARLAATAALAVLAGASVHAAQTFEPTIPKAIPESRPVAPAGTLAPPAAPPGSLASPDTTGAPPRLVQNIRRHQRDADARHCLQQAKTNKGIHRCAERYRPRGARATSVKKASVKPPAGNAAAPAVEISRTPDVVKPGAPRPGDAAKAADLVKPMDVTRPGGTPRPADAATVTTTTTTTTTAKPAAAKAADPAKPAAAGPKLPPMGSAADPTAAPPAKAAK